MEVRLGSMMQRHVGLDGRDRGTYLASYFLLHLNSQILDAMVTVYGYTMRTARGLMEVTIS